MKGERGSKEDLGREQRGQERVIEYKRPANRRMDCLVRNAVSQRGGTMYNDIHGLKCDNATLFCTNN